MKASHVFLLLITALAVFAQDARLSNLSIRAQGGGGDSLVTGFTIGPGPNKTVLIRAVGPTLGVFGVGGALSDPKLVLYNSTGVKIAENDDFNANDAATFASVGAFQLTPGGKDAALVATLAPGGYTAEVSGVGTAKGVALVEVYEVGGGSTRLINLSTRAKVGTGDGILIPGITISAGSSSRRLLIRAIGPTLGSFGVPGTLADPKLDLFSGSERIASNDNWETPIGVSSGTAAQLASIFTQAGAFALAAGSKDAALLTNLPPGNYTLQVSGVNNTTGEALVEVYDLSEPDSTEVKPNSNLYFAQLRPGPNSSASLASGFAAITFNPDGTALVSVNISNLSSPQSAAYLRLAGTNDYLLSLPLGQLAERPWNIGPVGIYSRNDIVKALNEGRLFISLETAKYPGGEVAGALVTSAGSRTFTAPAAPPALPVALLASPSDTDAARFLMQATFGPTDAAVAEVKRVGVNAWISAQIALPASSLLRTMRDDVARFPNPATNQIGMEMPRTDHSILNLAWWKLALTAPDQLRQRVAFALSEIFVYSSDDGARAEPTAQYFDLFEANAFGNFRTLLEQVTVHPEMGWYLTYLRNQKADPVKGTSPDENYAREVQQLFTVGLVQLQPDGTLLLDANGRPIPTYDNITITETAKVFTGWAYQNRNDNFFSDPAFDGTPGGFSNTSLYADTNGRLLPMKCYEPFHDKTEKRVISVQQAAPRSAPPTVIPANQTGPADVKILLDALFNHPNTGPFIVKQLIQRLVTSNPSTGYVYRAARVFADNGRGVRGDLGAVVTAILTDYEARSPDVAANVGFGKIKEPLLRLTALMRLLNTSSPNGRFLDSYFGDPRSGFYPVGFFAGYQGAIDSLGQSTLHAPSVFNFFSPFYSAPGPLADSGLVAPELQIVDSTYAIKAPNQLVSFIYKEPPIVANPPTPSPFLRNDFSSLLALSADAAALVDKINVMLCGGQMTTATRSILLQEMNALPLPTPVANFSGAPQKMLTASAGGLAAPKVSAFDPGGVFTLEAWVFPTSISPTDYGLIAGKRGEFTSNPFALFDLLMIPGGKVSLELSTGAVNSNRAVQTSNSLPLGKWTHVAATYDNATARIFFDGVQVAQASAVNATPPPNVNSPFSIGEGIRADGTTSIGRFTGLISQVRFWNVTRTATQILQGMKEGIPADKTGLVGNWLLDEGVGSSAADTSGNGYHLAPRNSTTAVTWSNANGQSLDRVQTALHLTLVSPDSALQK